MSARFLRFSVTLATPLPLVVEASLTRTATLTSLPCSPRFYSADRALIFSGTVICTSEVRPGRSSRSAGSALADQLFCPRPPDEQLPESDTRDIHAGVLALGGQVRRELTREVTHLICAAEHGAKYEMAIKHGTELGIVVVLPHWSVLFLRSLFRSPR